MISQATRDQICDRLAEGESLRAICRSEGMPTEAAIRKLAHSDPQFGTQYAAARAVGYERLADEILEISDDSSRDVIQTENGPKADAEVVARSRLRVDSRKWMLSKMLPKVYGDKIDLNHSGAVQFSRIEAVIVDPQD